ncbi:MAG: helix-hairpin-helix domain-containing protein [Candidatus Nealsonbacteria bacterium]|nr:helix-hairpin-helix domain-containing protein [Candidatus Nealsonbacteria bacterium]
MKSVIYISLFLICGFVLAANRVEINTASLEELDKITGIGPALGQRIIDGRPYLSIDDLLRVKGIGEKTLQKIKDQGLAYIEGQSANNVNPTPVIPSPTPALASPTLTLEPEPLNIFDNILINEIMPSPEGADDQNEWIKLINLNDFEVNLSGWSIKDAEGKTTTYAFPINTKISPNGFLILTRPETKISLNNDKDGLELIKPDKTIADSMKYEKAPTGQSYIRNGDKWHWSNALSEKKESTSIKTAENPVFMANQKTAWISQTEKSSDFYAWIIAVFTAICSSATILFLKIKIKSVDKEEFLG